MTDQVIGESPAVQAPVAKPALGHEYRVVWQREGLPKRRRIYQALKGAEGCAAVQVTATADFDWLSSPVPEIVSGPDIEVRIVGSWMPHTSDCSQSLPTSSPVSPGEVSRG